MYQNYDKIYKDIKSGKSIYKEIETNENSYHLKCDKNEALENGWISKSVGEIDISNNTDYCILITKDKSHSEPNDDYRNKILDIIENKQK